MNLFRTVVDVPESECKLDYENSSVWMGSCFTENIGSRLKQLKFSTEVNPFGILYNPESIRNSISLLSDKRFFTEKDLRYGNNLWYSFHHHSIYSHPDREICIERINKSIENASGLLKNAGFLFITFGTARVYQLKETGQIVSNCHKLPHKLFSHILMDTDKIISSYRLLIENLQKFNPAIKLVFTLSPVRHLKDGATGNQVSKSTLMLAISELQDAFDNVFYFPAYEIVMDELRDYRFYEEDMLHINKQGVDYIWKKFMNSFFTASTQSLVNDIAAVKQAIDHRPFNPATEKHHLFLKNLLEKISFIEKSVPTADFSKEKREISDRLKNSGQTNSFV